jgi:LPXTG-motif cell wall-anchored protein
MRRFAFVFLLAAVLAPAALAKGPSAASVTGPGLGKAVSVKGTEGSGALGDLTRYSGFFPAAFGQQPDPMLHGRPAGKLGPRFTIRYLVPGGGEERFRIRQDLYLYANGGALTYTRPGQRIFDMHTRGGWYRGGAALKQTLVRAGLPRTAPRSDSGSNSNLAVLLGIGAPGAALIAGAAVFLARRRQPA